MSKVNVLVTCNRTEGIEFDYDSGTYYKIYKEKPDVLPFSLIMKKRLSSLRRKKLQKSLKGS